MSSLQGVPPPETRQEFYCEVMADELETVSFEDRASLRAWLEQHYDDSPGVWVRISKARSGVSSASFQDLLEEGLCFGWSESQRRRGNDSSYLQRFTPRRRQGTTSQRNIDLAAALIANGKMTAAGRRALGLPNG